MICFYDSYLDKMISCFSDQKEQLPEGIHWIPDHQRLSCGRCHERFTFWKRRSHCRRCGEVFCRDCCFSTASSALKICNTCRTGEDVGVAVEQAASESANRRPMVQRLGWPLYFGCAIYVAIASRLNLIEHLEDDRKVEVIITISQ